MRGEIILSFFVKFMLSKIDSGSGIREFFTVFTIGKPCVIGIFMGDCAMINLFRASVADIRHLIQPVAPFFLKIFAGLITRRTGSTLNATKNDLATGIGLLAVITMNTEVLSVIKGAHGTSQTGDELLPLLR